MLIAFAHKPRMIKKKKLFCKKFKKTKNILKDIHTANQDNWNTNNILKQNNQNQGKLKF